MDLAFRFPAKRIKLADSLQAPLAFCRGAARQAIVHLSRSDKLEERRPQIYQLPALLAFQCIKIRERSQHVPRQLIHA